MPDTVKPTVKPPDRRSHRTRGLLLDALVALMIERGYERLTVQNLLDRADVGRATFYAHFESKDALLLFSIGGLRDWLTASSRGMPGPLGFTLPFFQHLASHSRLYQMTVVRDSEIAVERHMRHMLLDLVRDDLRPRVQRQVHVAGDAADAAAAPLELATQHVVGALWSTIVWWMAGASPLPPEEIHALFQRLTLPGLAAALGDA